MSTPSRWSFEQVQALAPDPASFIAARRLSRTISEAGGDGSVIWGLCKGSGKLPYKTCVEVSRPAFKCSCPSRKSPCKHALGLLLAWVEGAIPDASAPEWAVFPEKRAPATRVPSAKAVAARQERIAGGVQELRQWLRDQVRHGIAGLDQVGYRHFELMAARLVDAQAPGLATAVRSLASVPSKGEGWEGRLLTQLSLLHTLAGAWPLAVAASAGEAAGSAAAASDGAVAASAGDAAGDAAAASDGAVTGS
ncbi:SWIM zinc finger family protein, partial [Allorhizocola rhizosphaerae]|uniref:SWIM zinc finger family protein n=1 Tax=Allorhizocola rhizosphaerae TaxID=1872709 RepID=UPI0013C2A141